ncbi:PTS transporter subunit EIIB, partial [Lactiplantibacillus plantarum]|nr:PTS transporter subunit EIIB [Lactiplantibacillus plantarum]
MSKNYQVLAKKIIDIVGVDNVESVTHCQTRLRFVVKDPKQIDKAALEDLDEV